MEKIKEENKSLMDIQLILGTIGLVIIALLITFGLPPFIKNENK